MELQPLEDEVGRRLCQVVATRLTEEPVIALHGARAGGKSTLLEQIAHSVGRERIDLDDDDTLAAVKRDPTLFASGPSPVCIDEYQHAPAILSAIKAELNRDLRPGRFILTGSTTYDSLPLTAQSLTGRLHKLELWPLSQGEITGVHETFAAELIDDPAGLVTVAPSSTTRDEYIQRITRGGMPLAVARWTQSARSRWFDDYVYQVINRDVLGLSKIRQRAVMPLLVKQLATQTAQVLNIASASEQVGLDRSTGENYTELLEHAYLIHRLRAWAPGVDARVAARPKVHMTDSGVAARLARLTPEKLARRHPTALSHLGHLLETFVVNEILKQVTWLDEAVASRHLRTKDGTEVDLVLERDDGAIVGVEVKTGLSVPKDDFRGLRRLRDLAGDAFLGGVVLYLGRRSYTYDSQLHVTPVDRLWNP